MTMRFNPGEIVGTVSMTEAEWLAGTDPEPMLEFLRGKVSDRKLRLFAVACCRLIWHLLTDDRSRKAVEVAEQFADGGAWEEDRRAAHRGALDAGNAARRAFEVEPDVDWDTHCLAECSADAAHAAADTRPKLVASSAKYARDAVKYASRRMAEIDAERAAQCGLLRCVFGPVHSPAGVLPGWQEGIIPSLAQRIYDDRAFDRLPILADALEEAGCTDAAVLGHLRSPGPHVCGCWPLDLLLGKR
jgi:hypothetical protein